MLGKHALQGPAHSKLLLCIRIVSLFRNLYRLDMQTIHYDKFYNRVRYKEQMKGREGNNQLSVEMLQNSSREIDSFFVFSVSGV